MRFYFSIAFGIAVSMACLSPVSAQTQSVSADDPHACNVTSKIAAGDYRTAERCFRQALDERSVSDPQTALTVSNTLADLLREEGRVAEARRLYDDVLQTPSITPRQKFDALSGKADMDDVDGKTLTSTNEWGEALAIARGEGNADMEASALRGLGSAWLNAEDTSRAEPLLRRALSLLENNPSAPPVELSTVLVELGRCYRTEDKLALAEDALSRALEVHRKSVGASNPEVAFIMNRLAEVYAQRKEFAQARDMSAVAGTMLRMAFGGNSIIYAAALVSRANIEVYAGAPQTAIDNYAAALQIAQARPGNTVFEQRLIEQYAALLKSVHRDREARELTALARTLTPPGEPHSQPTD